LLEGIATDNKQRLVNKKLDKIIDELGNKQQSL